MQREQLDELSGPRVDRFQKRFVFDSRHGSALRAILCALQVSDRGWLPAYVLYTLVKAALNFAISSLDPTVTRTQSGQTGQGLPI